MTDLEKMFAISKTWFWVPFTFRLHYQLLTLCLITRLVDTEVRISEGLAFSAGQTSSVSHTELDQDGCWTFLRKGSGYGRSSCNQMGSCVIKNHFTFIIWSKPHTYTQAHTKKPMKKACMFPCTDLLFIYPFGTVFIQIYHPLLLGYFLIVEFWEYF